MAAHSSLSKLFQWGIDLGGHLRLLFMGGRGIQAVTRQNSEPNWIAYVGLRILLGPQASGREVR